MKSGRTHLMDATPVTLGQEFGGYAQQVESAIVRIKEAVPRVAEVPLGGTAVGTGINAPKTFAPRVITGLAEKLELPLQKPRITSRHRAPATRWSRCQASCAPLQSA